MVGKAADTKDVDEISIVLIDEHPLMGAGVRAILETEWGMKVIAETDSLEDALGVCLRRHPDVVLMDLHGSAPGAMQGLRRLRRECADCGVVILVHRDDDEALFQAVVAGANAHVVDDAQPQELARTIERVASGDEPIDELLTEHPLVRDRVLATLRQMPLSGLSLGSAAETPLTARQLTILRHAAEGLTNREIAQALGTREQTVKNQMSDILHRLSLKHRTEAVIHALRQGWINLPAGPTDVPSASGSTVGQSSSQTGPPSRR